MIMFFKIHVIHPLMPHSLSDSRTVVFHLSPLCGDFPLLIKKTLISLFTPVRVVGATQWRTNVLHRYVLGSQHVRSAWSMLSPGVASWHLRRLTRLANLIQFLINSFFSPHLIFYFYNLEIIQHKYKTKSLWKLTLRLLSLYYLDILVHLPNG